MRELVLGVVQAGAFERLGEQPGESGEVGALVGGEVVGMVEGEHPGAHGPAGGDQRQEGPGGHVVVADGLGIDLRELAPGGEEQRHAGCEGVRAGRR